MKLVVRSCNICDKPLPRTAEGMQTGWYCCGDYFDTEMCLNKSFEGTGDTWEEHYDDSNDLSHSGDCYFTEWEDEEE